MRSSVCLVCSQTTSIDMELGFCKKCVWINVLWVVHGFVCGLFVPGNDHEISIKHICVLNSNKNSH